MVRIRTEALHVMAGGRTLIENLSLEVAAGSSLSIVGPSGSGKTTLLNCLCGIHLPEKGRVFVDDVIINDLSTRGRARYRLRNMGMVFQSGELVPELTVLDNVMLPLLLDNVPEREANGAVLSVLDRLGVTTLRERYPESLSGGETQRVGVARALVRSPGIVFADEPTGALDDANAGTVVDLLIEAATEAGAAVVIVTHDQDVAARTDSSLRLENRAAQPTPEDEQSKTMASRVSA